MLKRFFDIVVSALGLIAAAPLMAAIAVAIKIGSPGPVFFRQERVGRDFRRFKILKFRTMVVDAPKLGGQITQGNDDPRITSIGKFLRKTKLDELPQLINVLRGEMSFVGPRPEVPRYVELFRNDYAEILRIRPGITDPASLKYRDEGAILAQAADHEAAYVEQILPDKIALAKEYVRSRTLTHDVVLLFRTVFGR